MDEDTIRHAFEPFFTTKEGAGSGLGLAIVYGAVQQLGGRVRIESAPGEGATFHLVLPGSRLPPEPAAARESPRRECTETILVADDNEGVRSFIRRVLVGAGYRVVEAASGPDAERTIRSGDPPVDLLLADVVMPGLDGFELGEAVRELDSRIRIVHMSGYAPRGVPERPELQGVFLAKPFTPDVLLDRVRQALDAPS
jgi:CheY-like chemotaxis protein